MATVNSIALDLIAEQGEAADDAGYVALVEKYVNDALDEIAIATNWNSFRARNTFSTAIGQAVYDLPAGAREIIQLRFLDTGEPLALITIQEAARRSLRLEDTGRPRAWLEDGVLTSGGNVLYRIRLAPVPDSILQIEREYFYHPSDVGTAQTLPVQDQHIVLVKDRARAYLLERDQKYDAADRAQRRFETNLTKLVKRELRKVAAKTVLKQTDLANIRKRERAIFDP